MSYDYSENILVQNSAGNLLHDELGFAEFCTFDHLQPVFHSLKD